MATETKVVDEVLRLQQLAQIQAQRAAIEDICHRYSVAKLALFGSIIHADEFGPESDIDFLVEFLPDVSHGLSFWGMELDLEDLIGRKVDLNTAEWLSRYFRDEVIEEAQVFYAAP
jgi:hypothetical protein